MLLKVKEIKKVFLSSVFNAFRLICHGKHTLSFKLYTHIPRTRDMSVICCTNYASMLI